tara:strand:- start:1145 stop:1312 length:168 start_codon:yes stop_codon:yes gene_type:complete
MLNFFEISIFLILKLSANKKVVEKKILNKVNITIIGYIFNLDNKILLFIFININD